MNMVSTHTARLNLSKPSGK